MLNRYGYARNNPMRYRDTNGREPFNMDPSVYERRLEWAQTHPEEVRVATYIALGGLAAFTAPAWVPAAGGAIGATGGGIVTASAWLFTRMPMWMQSLFAGGRIGTTSTTDTIQRTVHGGERIAGPLATRGGVLAEETIIEVRAGGQMLTQADGAIVRVLQRASGRFDVVIDGERGLITTFANITQKSLDRLARRYGWE